MNSSAVMPTLNARNVVIAIAGLAVAYVSAVSLRHFFGHQGMQHALVSSVLPTLGVCVGLSIVNYVKIKNRGSH